MEQQVQRPAWQTYFSEQRYSDDDRRALLIKDISDFFSNQPGWDEVLSKVRQPPRSDQAYALDLDFEKLVAR
jgi:hypothetical protein